jgi:hypothetical protein
MSVKKLKEDIAVLEEAIEASVAMNDEMSANMLREQLKEIRDELKEIEGQKDSQAGDTKADSTEAPKKRGRKAGTTVKKADSTEAPKKRGRKAGTTVKKADSTEAPKKRGRKAGTTVKKDKPTETEKKPVKIVGKTVTFNGKEYESGSKELCDAVIDSFNKRREKAKKQAKKTKTKSVFEKAADKVENTIVSAVKETFAENKDKIVKQPDQYFAKIQKVQAAGQEFLESFKELVGSEFDRKEITDFTKTIKEAVEGLKKEIEKISKESKK